MLNEILLSLPSVIEIVIFVITIAGLYWKMQIDLKELDLKIRAIECDRSEKWNKQNESDEKVEAYLSDIAKGIAEMKGDMKSVKTDIQWLKK